MEKTFLLFKAGSNGEPYGFPLWGFQGSSAGLVHSFSSAVENWSMGVPSTYSDSISFIKKSDPAGKREWILFIVLGKDEEGYKHHEHYVALDVFSVRGVKERETADMGSGILASEIVRGGPLHTSAAVQNPKTGGAIV